MWSRREEYNDYPNDDSTDSYASRDQRRSGKASRVDAERRTLESFNERKEWDPTSAPKAAAGDNTDYEWDRKTRGREDRAMYDSWAQPGVYEDEDEYEDEEVELGADKDRDLDNTFSDMSWREEERALGPRHNERDWRNFVRNDRTDELYERGQQRMRPRYDNEELKRKTEREWVKKGRPENVHVVCVDETKDAERVFKFAVNNLPRDHRLVLAHGIYEGLLGHTRADEARVRRLYNKYRQSCSDLGRDCTFKHFHFTSSGNFGEEVCDLAERAHAKSVLVGKRTHVSDVRRTLAGSSSRSVLDACRVPVSIVIKGEKGLATTGTW